MFQPFCKKFWLLLCLTIGGSFFLSSFDERIIHIVLTIVQFFSTILYIIYKLHLPHDKQYNQIQKEHNMDASCFYNEMLPLQLCNVGYLLIPFYLFTRNHSVLVYLSFVLPFSTLMAVTMPCVGFEKYDMKELRMIGYFGTHFLLMFVSLTFWFSRIYVPEYKDIMIVFVLFMINLTVSHLSNLLIRKYTNCKRVNFLFTMNSNYNPVLEFFYRLFPHPYFYMIPIALLYSALCFIFVFLYEMIF